MNERLEGDDPVDRAERLVDEIDAAHWDCLAGPPPGRWEPWIIGGLAVLSVIVWYFHG